MTAPKKKAAGPWMLHAKVREAYGLTADEKLLLHTIASHQGGESFGKRKTLMRWTGLSERRFRRAITGVVAKGMVVKTERPGRSTKYRIDEGGFKRLAAAGPATTMVTARDRSGRPTRDHSDRTSPDRCDPLKKNPKSNHEEIKNIKPSRKVRPPRRQSSPANDDRDAMEAKTVKLRQRITDRKEGSSGPRTV